MKTAEEILDEYLQDYPWQYWSKENAIKAMEAYAAQQKPPSSATAEEPHRCPVCGGNGLVPNGFYDQTSGQWTSCSTLPETCRSCNGTGVIFAALAVAGATKERDELREKYSKLLDATSELLRSMKTDNVELKKSINEMAKNMAAEIAATK